MFKKTIPGCLFLGCGLVSAYSYCNRKEIYKNNSMIIDKKINECNFLNENNKKKLLDFIRN